MAKKKKTIGGFGFKTEESKPKTTFMEELVARPIQQRDFPHALEAFNKMTDKERKKWRETMEDILTQEGVPSNQWQLRIADEELQFQREYKEVKENNGIDVRKYGR